MALESLGESVVELTLPQIKCKFCPKCGFPATTWPDMELHLEKCFRDTLELWQIMPSECPKSSLTCVPCSGVFPNRSQLRIHKQTQCPGKPSLKRNQCPICRKSFRSSQYLPDHMNTHTGERPYQCDVCDKTFKERSVLQQHLTTHSKTKRFTCDICDKTFKRRESLRYHQSSHANERAFMCSSCAKSFRNEKDLKAHEKSMHSDDLTVKKHVFESTKICEICDEVFKNYNAYNYHKKTKHSLGVKCDECEHIAMSKSQLEVHMRVHTGEKPFLCRFCDKSFSRQNHLKIHESRHSRKQLHTCRICGKGFPQQCEVRAHEKTHEAQSGLVCPKCGDVFHAREAYDAHMRLHGQDAAEMHEVTYDPTDVLFEEIEPVGTEGIVLNQEEELLHPGSIQPDEYVQDILILKTD